MWSSRPAPESAAAALATPVVPGTQPAPQAPANGEQAPQAARHRPAPVRKTAPTRRLQPGDLICGACGEGNGPLRKFCSRCGESLVEAEVVKRPWWKILLPHSRGPKVVAVKPGERHQAGKGFDVKLSVRKLFRRLRTVLVVLILVGGAAYGAIPSVRHSVDAKYNQWFNKVKNDIKPTYVPVHPVSEAANMHIGLHGGNLAVDEFYNTYWLAPWHQNDEPKLTLNFGSTVSLKYINVYSGDAAAYVTYGRPSVLHLVYSTGQSDTVTVTDQSKIQTIYLSHAAGITSVEIEVAGIYQGNSGANVAISEIEFYAEKL